MKIGLFFGSFNPIHIGHLIVANMVYEMTDMNQIWFVVSPQNPFKKNKTLLHEFDRLDLVNAAIRDHHHFKAHDIEFSLPRPSHTINTITHLKSRYADHEFKLIIGEDNLGQFTKWKNYQEILNQHGIIVYPRKVTIETPLVNHENIEWISAPLLDISASHIRQMLKEGKVPKYLVPEEVLKLIELKEHYT
jgi:nicotinate-nucleotide adenylyltransferase